MNKCAYCGNELTTNSFSNICKSCRNKLNNDLQNEVLFQSRKQMSKELEALKILKANAILFDDGTDFGASTLEAINDLDIYLTPPTEEEVCEHLNESFGLKGKDTNLHFIYDKESREFRMVSQGQVYRYISTKRQSEDSIEFIDLDIDDIVILGRFYEGEIGKGAKNNEL